MKKKMVVKVTMNGEKSRSKALQIAVGLSGVESASLKGEDKSQIEVTSLLRKSVGYAELVSVADAGGDGEKKEEKKEEPKSEAPLYYHVSTPYYPPYYYHSVPSYGYVEDHGPSCSIM